MARLMSTLDDLIRRLDANVEALMEAYGTPGVALALTDRRSTLGVRTYGFADLAAGTPVAGGTLFETGSIGKSFTAAALMQLHQEGRLDLHAPVTESLPWFEIRTAFAPITVHHLLTHTAGLIEGADMSSDSRFDVWAVREIEAASPPGERFWYSNIGYRTLGVLLEELEGRPYADIVRDRVLEPAGMDATEAEIANRIRPRMAVGYWPSPDDRPVAWSEPQEPAPWLETNTGDGCLASPAGDLAAYLRVWLNEGRGDRGAVVSPESFALMTSSGLPEEDGGGRYGYGLRCWTDDGHPHVGHGGDMPGFASSMHADLESGFGVAVLINGMEWEDYPIDVVRFGLRLLRALASGDPLPEAPPHPDQRAVRHAGELAGSFRDPETGSALELAAAGDALDAEVDGARARLLRAGEDRFLLPLPGFERFALHAVRRDGAVASMAHGPRRWVREGSTDDARPHDPALSAFEGHYRSSSPWLTNFRVVQRNGALVWILPGGWEEPMTPLGDGLFRVGADDWSPERLRFDAVVDGRALRASRSGCDYYRAFTP
jgi:CubicO group peptidase (beta-lactamase class C family)